MRRSIVSILIACGSTLAVSSTAFGTDNGHHGADCNPANPVDAGRISNLYWGVQNNSTTDIATVQCAGSPVFNSNINLMTATIYDRHTAREVCCTFLIQTSDATLITQLTRCSSGSSSPQTLSFTPPPNSAHTAKLECTIPERTAAGMSHVTSYRIRS
jgi:hypothetical protein